jgi:hypothetical protein
MGVFCIIIESQQGIDLGIRQGVSRDPVSIAGSFTRQPAAPGDYNFITFTYDHYGNGHPALTIGPPWQLETDLPGVGCRRPHNPHVYRLIIL